MTNQEQPGSAVGDRWEAIPMANPGWSSLIVPEAEGFDLVMPTWVVDRIIADHEQAVWAREVAKPALEQTGLDVARAALASFPQ